MNPPIKYRRPVQRYRFDRKGNVILDDRSLENIEHGKTSSPARLQFKAARKAARNAKRPAAIAARIAEAATRNTASA